MLRCSSVLRFRLPIWLSKVPNVAHNLAVEFDESKKNNSFSREGSLTNPTTISSKLFAEQIYDFSLTILSKYTRFCVEAKTDVVENFVGISSTSSSDISSDMSSGRRDNTGRPASPTRKPNQSEQSVQSPNPSPASPGQHVSNMIQSKAFSDHPMLTR